MTIDYETAADMVHDAIVHTAMTESQQAIAMQRAYRLLDAVPKLTKTTINQVAREVCKAR